jgi:thiosulfate/3-mercaptopyruvate sulfurtransferase
LAEGTSSMNRKELPMRTVFSLTATLILPLTLLAGAKGYPRGELLAEPAELAQPAVAKDYIVLDSRPREAFEAGHIPGARWVDHNTWAKAFGDGSDATGWGQRIGALGIGPKSKVVVYDEAANKSARIWWILRYCGLDHVRLLNGGWTAWKTGKFPTASGAAPPVEPVAMTARPRAALLVNKGQVKQALQDNLFRIVDARTEAENAGRQKQAKKAGAIPGAKHLDWEDLLDEQTKRFKPADELSALFRSADIVLDEPTACYCQSGGRSSVMVFAMELMGAKDVRNYYGSWSEWGNADDTPVELGKPKK